MQGFGKGSKDRYPAGSKGSNGSIPPAQANMSNGQIVGPGSSDSYPGGKGGNNWPAPNNRATASDGQTTGHPSQKTTYPGKGPNCAAKTGVEKCSSGRNQYCPKGGNKL